MRLGIFIACIVALILGCRFYSLPPAGQQSKNETQNEVIADQNQALSDPSVAVAVYDEPVQSPRIAMPDQSQEDCGPIALPKGNVPFGVSELGSNAKNVQTLVRAQYEVPKSSAAILMKLETEVLVEVTELESGHPDTSILQVTTDEETQKRISGFLMAFYPESSIVKIRQQNAKIVSVGHAQPIELDQ